ncbi:NAD(P)-dependent oxidoreductase [Insolitispirillum peregrinum]|uniref:NAD(P)-dependent oxidoreductase n=1 Tax=Insolitispirillum peregrinum TaxID=80876 RepID=UPI003605BCFE
MNDSPLSVYQDLVPPMTDLQASAEANRCLFCYDAACTRACPTSIDIPGFIRGIATGNLTGAATTIFAENILGGTCGRVCPTETLCEQACVRTTAEDRPVAIGRLQRYATDAMITSGRQPFERAPATGKTVAVVGAGPAGLSCAHRLALLGHQVSLYDAKPKAGGLNEYGLAAYKMADDFAAREVAFVLGIGGITLYPEQRLGHEITLDGLRQTHDAVFLAIGLGGSNRLSIPGEDLSGVEDATAFIERLRQSTPSAPPAVPDSVVVIGGGNTAIDAAIQAKRLGAAEVTLVYRRGREQMKATGWEQDLALTSGVILRTFAEPRRMDGDGHVQTITFERTTLSDGRLTGTGSTLTLSADLVLKAVGQTLLTGALAGIAVQGGKIVVDDAAQTSIPGVYAGGDCIASGEDLTVQAVEDGKRAAHAIDAALRLSALTAA